MTTYTQDTFTDVDETLLQNHTPNVGTGWTLVEGSLKIFGNTTKVVTDTINSRYTANSVSLINVYEVIASIQHADFPRIYGRFIDTANHYFVNILNFSGTTELIKNVAGTWTTLGSYTPPTFSTAIFYKYALRLRATKEVFIDDVQRISSTDDSITGVGKGALSLNRNGQALDNFFVRDIQIADETIREFVASYARSPQPTKLFIIRELINALDRNNIVVPPKLKEFMALWEVENVVATVGSFHETISVESAHVRTISVESSIK